MVRPNLFYEKSIKKKNFRWIVGIDEVGRGSWVGSLVAAGVILPDDFEIPKGLRDSKLVSPRERIRLSEIIKESSLWTVAEINSKDIDLFGIAKSTQMVFGKIVRALKPNVDFCLIDAFHLKYFPKNRQLAIKKGDAICASIAAASIIAKVHRDALMSKLHIKYPQYGWDRNKGYGTEFHQKAITSFGLSIFHRQSFNLCFLS